jgi:Tfp pilus assembly protein PilO
MRIQNKFGALITLNFLIPFFLLLSLIGVIIRIVSSYSYNLEYHDQLRALVKQKSILQERQKKIEEQKVILNIKEANLSKILGLLIKSSKNSGALLGTISVGHRMEYRDAMAIPLTITVKGNYNQIARLVNILEREDIRFQLIEISLSTKETKGMGIIGRLKGYFALLE